MKYFKSLLFAVTAMVSMQTAKAQTADEVINKFIVAIGGKEKMMALNSVKLDGSLSVQGFDIGVTITVLNGKGSRTDISVPGQSDGYRIMTPTGGWNYLPFRGMTAPEASTDDEVKAGQAALDLQTPLLDYATKGHKVELLGKDTVEGTACYKLKMTYKNGKTSTLYIDAKTYYKIKSVSSMNMNGTDTAVETTYTDFRKTPEGYVFPYSQTSISGTITFNSIEVNKPVDENIFKAN